MECKELNNERRFTFGSAGLYFQREAENSALLITPDGKPAEAFCLKVERPLELSLTTDSKALILKSVVGLYELPHDSNKITLFYFDLEKVNSTLKLERDGTGIGVADVRDIFRTGTRKIKFDINKTPFRLWETKIGKAKSEVPAFVISFPATAVITESE